MSETEERAKLAYEVFRGGCRNNAPAWDKLPFYARDAVLVCYAQGKFDGRLNAKAAAEIASLKAQRDKLAEALKFYADENNHGQFKAVESDNGYRARKALEEATLQ